MTAIQLNAEILRNLGALAEDEGMLKRVAKYLRIVTGTDTVLITKLLGLKVRHFNNSCLLIAFTRSIHALFSM